MYTIFNVNILDDFGKNKSSTSGVNDIAGGSTKQPRFHGISNQSGALSIPPRSHDISVQPEAVSIPPGGRATKTGFNSLEERPTTSIAGWHLKFCSMNVTNL